LVRRFGSRPRVRPLYPRVRLSNPAFAPRPRLPPPRVHPARRGGRALPRSCASAPTPSPLDPRSAHVCQSSPSPLLVPSSARGAGWKPLPRSRRPVLLCHSLHPHRVSLPQLSSSSCIHPQVVATVAIGHAITNVAAVVVLQSMSPSTIPSPPWSSDPSQSYSYAHPCLASLAAHLHGAPTTRLLRSHPSSAPPSRLTSSPSCTGKPCSIGGPRKGTPSNLTSSLLYFISLPSQSQVI
jgi:hypothetical protein